MASPLLQVLVYLEILVLLMASGCVPNPCRRVVDAQEQREFDFFLLSLQWPGTLCRRSLNCCSSNACCRGSNAPTEFTIHGLWTNYNDGTWPACCSGSNFDIKEKVLNDAGYVPSNSERYPLGGIISTIQNAFHATPSLTCSDGAVEELRLCFYKDFKPRDCVIRFSSQHDIPSSNNCPKYVRFPAFTPLRLGNGDASSWLTQNEAL